VRGPTRALTFHQLRRISYIASVTSNELDRISHIASLTSHQFLQGMHTLQPQVPQGLHALRPPCPKAEHLPAAYNTAYNTARPDGVRACAGGAGEDEDEAASFLQTLLKIELVGTAVPPSWQEGVHYVMQGSKDSSKKVVKTVDRAGGLSGAPRAGRRACA